MTHNWWKCAKTFQTKILREWYRDYGVTVLYVFKSCIYSISCVKNLICNFLNGFEISRQIQYAFAQFELTYLHYFSIFKANRSQNGAKKRKTHNGINKRDLSICIHFLKRSKSPTHTLPKCRLDSVLLVPPHNRPEEAEDVFTRIEDFWKIYFWKRQFWKKIRRRNSWLFFLAGKTFFCVNVKLSWVGRTVV